MARCPGVQGRLAALLVRPAIILVTNWPEQFIRLDSSHAAVGLGKNLFPLFARALDLDPDFFDDKVRILLVIDQRQHGLCGTALMMIIRR